MLEASVWFIAFFSVSRRPHSNLLTFKPSFYVFMFGCVGLIASDGQGHPCYPCDNPLLSFYSCSNSNSSKENESKIVQYSGLCAKNCDNPATSCNHQTGTNGTGCQFFGSYGKAGCSAADIARWSDTASSILQCDGPSGRCQCPPAAFGHVPLEDDVVITAYPFECDCADTVATNQYATTPDIVITNSGWRELAMVSTSSRQEWWCGQFVLSGDGGAPGQRLRYDCPEYRPLEHGSAVSLQLCTAEHTVSFSFQLPDITHISYRSGLRVETWEPLIAVHTHRSDRLVYSVQRSPPALNISRYRVRLVRCLPPDAGAGAGGGAGGGAGAGGCSRNRTVEGTERRVTEPASRSVDYPGVFRVSFDPPEEMANLSLLVEPEGGRPTLSAVILHPGKNTAAMAIFGSVMALVLVLPLAVFVWCKVFYRPTVPAEVEVLVLYNSHVSLARHLALLLETHCKVRTRLDVVDIPRAGAGMDPVEWLTEELDRCRTVLLLVFPDGGAPPIYPRLYSSAVHHLQMDAGRSRVVVGHTGGAGVTLPRLPAARVCRLPDQLGRLVRAVRGAPVFGTGSLDAFDLARDLTGSEDGRRLAAMLKSPGDVAPPEMAPLPVQPAPPPEPEPLLPPAPARHEHLLAPHVPAVAELLGAEPPSHGPRRQSTPDDEPVDLDDVQWHD